MAAKDRIMGALFTLKASNQNTVGLAAGATLQVPADRFFVEDPTVTTKRLKFDVSAITAATDRTVTYPDYSFSPGTTLGLRRNVRLASTALTLTDAMSGSLVVIDAGAQAIVLPALTTNLGVYYDFIVQTTSSAVTITASSGDILHGGVTIMSTGAGVENDAFSANGSSDLVFTMNGTTKGGIIGSVVTFTAWSATAWLVSGNLIGSGTIITPFS